MTYNVVKDSKVENHEGKSDTSKLFWLMSLQKTFRSNGFLSQDFCSISFSFSSFFTRFKWDLKQFLLEVEKMLLLVTYTIDEVDKISYLQVAEVVHACKIRHSASQIIVGQQPENG